MPDSKQEELGFIPKKFVLHYGHNVYHCENGGMTRNITEAAVFESRSSALLEIKRLRRDKPQLPYPSACRLH